MTYEPSVTVIAQGRKRVELGRTTFHLRCVAIPADVGRFAGRQPGDRGK